mgnify:CR=1 FL=1
MKIFNKKVENRVLVIGDLHEPFTIESYIDFCKKVYKEWKCNKVIFIGDEIDYHASSFHISDPNGMSSGDEFKKALVNISKWYKAFPEATVIIGNHTRMIMRKAHAGGIPNDWIKSYNDALKVQNWKFVIEYELDNVLYFHGEGSTARTKAKTECKSVVQGHRHSEGYIEWINNDIFSMQVGCGVDRTSYAMAYGIAGKKPIISCGVVIDGKNAYLEKL